MGDVTGGGCRCKQVGQWANVPKLPHFYTTRLHAGDMLNNVDASKRTSSKHGSFGFDSFDSIGADKSEVLSWSDEPESKEEGLPEKDPAEMAVDVYDRIR